MSKLFDHAITALIIATFTSIMYDIGGTVTAAVGFCVAILIVFKDAFIKPKPEGE